MILSAQMRRDSQASKEQLKLGHEVMIHRSDLDTRRPIGSKGNGAIRVKKTGEPFKPIIQVLVHGHIVFCEHRPVSPDFEFPLGMLILCNRAAEIRDHRVFGAIDPALLRILGAVTGIEALAISIGQRPLASKSGKVRFQQGRSRNKLVRRNL